MVLLAHLLAVFLGGYPSVHAHASCALLRLGQTRTPSKLKGFRKEGQDIATFSQPVHIYQHPQAARSKSLVLLQPRGQVWL